MDPKERTQNIIMSLAAFSNQWSDDDVEDDSGWTWADGLLIWMHFHRLNHCVRSMQNRKCPLTAVIRTCKWFNIQNLKQNDNQVTVSTFQNIIEFKMTVLSPCKRKSTPWKIHLYQQHIYKNLDLCESECTVSCIKHAGAALSPAHASDCGRRLDWL